VSLRAVPAWAGDALTGTALALAGAVFAALAWPIPQGDVGNPGPGFLPFVLGVMLVVLGLLCAARAYRHRAGSASVTLVTSKAFICLAALAAAAVAFIPLGFLPTVAIFLTILFRVLAGSGWVFSASTAVAATVVLWLFFDRLLGLGLPAGIVPLG
jgi:putative tricarboxylic transport membrane protein